MLGLIRDRAELLVVGPDADAIADSVKPLVKNVAHHKAGFSQWVQAGCPDLKSPRGAKGDPRTYAIIGAGMEVHKELGCGFREPLCQEAFAIELGKRGIPFEREKCLRVQYKDVLLEKECSPDFICFGEAIVETKVLDRLTGKEESQLIHYLKASGLHVGLLLNFGGESFEWKRIVV
ncbi:MAG: GxxExxY protein [Planctomycetes bacterium]|nr:GxxExxY protein [Planctomycetota bacterium]